MSSYSSFNEDKKRFDNWRKYFIERSKRKQSEGINPDFEKKGSPEQLKAQEDWLLKVAMPNMTEI